MLSIENLSLRIAGRLLLDQASAQIQDGSRVGLVGRNGTGKTTLFSAITGDLAPEQGKITLPARASMGRLSQEAPDGPEPLIEVVLAADKERMRLLIEAETARDPHRIAEIQTRLADMDAHAAPARAASILAGLGFSEEAQSRPCSEFSGGWRMRVALAALLFSQPDLLLLDEPTNYLDLEGAMWLETFLAKYPYTVIIISHDRDLLDTAVDWILHLDRTKLTLYRGGYSAFEKQRRERQNLDVKFVKRQQAERKRLTAFIERFRAKATKARQAQSRMKLLAKMEPAPEIVADEVRPIEIPSPARLLSPPIIAIDDASIGYVADTPVLRRLTLRVDHDDRIALLGANGNGKSTLAKLLAGRLAPMSGGIVRADKLQVAYFAQHQLDELHENESSYDHVRNLMRDAPEAKVRARVGRIGFSGDAANVAVSKLSGGEKARLLLGLATFNHPHLVLLDEPTNHLDIQARTALIEAINEYTGAVILISHDRYLIEACADRLWLVANGGVTPFDGDLDDYRRQVLSDSSSARANADSKSARTSRNDLRRAAAGKRAELAPLRKRLDGLDKTIAQRNREIAKLDAALAEPGLYDRDPARGAQLAKQRTEAVSVLAKAEDDWLTLSQQYDSAIAAE